MKKWPVSQILLSKESKSTVKAISPQIISASRATDIPAFYGKWLISQFEQGYTIWRNPFNNKESTISLSNCKLIIFWTKNAAPFLKHLSYFQKKNIDILFLYSLNYYDIERYEPNLPEIDKRISTFKKLSNIIGPEKVAWRFDPLLLSSTLSIDELFERILYVGNSLKDDTRRLIMSFIKINRYTRVQKNITTTPSSIRELNSDEKKNIIQKVSKKCKDWKISPSMCGTEEDFSNYGISSSACIDYDEISTLFSGNEALMDFLEYKGKPLFHSQKLMPKKLKSQGQQPHCGCLMSKDIGFYNSCPHGCIYCYANVSTESAKENYNRIKKMHYNDNKKLQNRYYALRHGESLANLDGIILSDPKNGVSSYGLSREGRDQVIRTAQSYNEEINSTIIITSDFLRAHETAMLFADIIGCKCICKDPRLRERFFGDFEKTDNSNYDKVWQKDRKNADHTWMNVESTSSVLKRTCGVLMSMEEENKNKNIILVSHGDSLQILQTYFYNIPPELHRTLPHLKTAELRKLSLQKK